MRKGFVKRILAVFLVFSLAALVFAEYAPGTSASGGGGGYATSTDSQGGGYAGGQGMPEGYSNELMKQQVAEQQAKEQAANDVQKQVVQNTVAIPVQRMGPAPILIGPSMPQNLNIDEMVAQKFGDKLFGYLGYSEQSLAGMCSDEKQLVDYVYNEVVTRAGFDVNEEVCEPMAQGISNCEEAVTMCDKIIGPTMRVGGSPYSEGEEVGCPPDETKLKALCVQRMQDEFAARSEDETERSKYDCGREYWMNQGNFQRMCQEASGWSQPAGAENCEAWESFLQRCMGSAGVQPYQQTQTPNVGSCPQLPPINEAEKLDCTSRGGEMISERDAQGCLMPPHCVGAGQQTPIPTTNYGCAYGNPPCPEGYACVNNECVSGAPTPQPTQTPLPTPTPEQTPWPTPTIEQTPLPTATPEPSRPPEPTPTPGGNFSAMPFTAFEIAYDQMKQKCWEDYQARYRGCGTSGSQVQQPQGPWGMSVSDLCSEETFIAKCAEKRLAEQLQAMSSMNVGKICDYETRANLVQFKRFCKDSSRGYEDCKKRAQEGCDFAEKAVAKCKEIATEAKVKEIIARKAHQFCKFRAFMPQGIRKIDLNSVSPNDLIPIIVATPDSISANEDAQLRSLGKVLGYQVIGGMRIYSMDAAAGSFYSLKQLLFVQDVQIDQIRHAITSNPTAVKPIEQAITALEAAKPSLPSADYQTVATVAQNDLLNVDQGIEQAAGGKDLAYQIQWLFGVVAEREKQDAAKITEESNRLSQTIMTLQQLADNVDDTATKTALLQQVDELKKQKESFDGMAKSKNENAGGIISVVSKLFGG